VVSAPTVPGIERGAKNGREVDYLITVKVRPGSHITYRASCAGEIKTWLEKNKSRLGPRRQVYLGDLPAPEKNSRRKANEP